MRREEGGVVRLVEFVKAFYLGGTEGQVVELLRGLPKDAWQVKVGVNQSVGPLMEQVWQLGHVPEEFPLNGSLARANTAWQVARMARWLRAERIQLVHVHDFYSSVIVVPAARLAGAKVVVGRLDLGHWLGQARGALFAQLTRMADGVVANAMAIRDMLVHQEAVDPARIAYIPNGLDLPRFDERVRAGLEAPLPDTAGEPVVVHVANFNHIVKRQEDVLEALAQLKGQGTRLHVFFVGDGPRRADMEARARALGLSDQAHFLGHRTDVPAICAQATLGVLASTHEGMSNAVMECMAAGLPMVVTRAGANPDLIEDGVRGRLVDSERPEQLAQAFGELLSAPGAARRMGREARAFVEKELSLERLVQRHEALYRQVLGLPQATQRPAA